ncbi:MAG TPA: glycosyltransferase family 4 protein [Actinomycetota bacterium]|nr:glycosyltransferase family 4 protein [Actinomycetota bacterium]
MSGTERDLLVFNLATDDDDPILGFAAVWVRALAARCQRVDVITMRAGRFESPANVRLFSVGKERGYGEARRGLEFYRILGRLVRETRYSACFAHMMPLFALMASPVLKTRRIPITLWYAHGSTSRRLWATEKVVDRVVTSTEHGFRLPSKKLVVVGQGIATDVMTPGAEERGDSPPVIASMGRVSPVKRIDIFLDAIAELAASHPDVVARVVGPVADPEHQATLEDRARRLGIDDRVTWVGAVPPANMVDEYRRSDVVVNVSETGSLDKTALEAMSCGVPVVTSSSAVASVVGAIDRSLVVEPTPASVAGACGHVLDLPALERRELGRRLRATVEERHGLDGLISTLMDRGIAWRN